MIYSPLKKYVLYKSNVKCMGNTAKIKIYVSLQIVRQCKVYKLGTFVTHHFSMPYCRLSINYIRLLWG